MPDGKVGAGLLVGLSGFLMACTAPAEIGRATEVGPDGQEQVEAEAGSAGREPELLKLESESEPESESQAGPEPGLTVPVPVADSGSSSSAEPSEWTEEFDTLDPARWKLEYSTFGDPESQHCYRPENVTVGGGSLLITARAGEVGCPESVRRRYSSGMIQSKGRVDWTYGRFEIEARFPVGAGLWPAIWMSPAERTFGPWPRSGEIDIVEVLGDAPETSVCSLHYWDQASDTHGKSVGRHQSHGNGFRTYGLSWSPSELIWDVDGEECHRVDLASNGQQDVFAEPFYLRINLAVGGRWPGPVDPGVLPAVMEVSSIRYRPLTAD